MHNICRINLHNESTDLPKSKGWLFYFQKARLEMKALLVSAMLMFSLPAYSNTNCFPESEIKDIMESEGMKLVWRGQSSGRYFVELFENTEKFMVLTTLDGISCVADRGWRIAVGA